ncbi:helix-turn-helix transcriptional regulator [Aureibacillus halotolerans]|uniref:AraC-like DNA-binding protein n=1 Tax=Aureibacillus halotolerans TaxID=1508390 RepID=A0A4R6U3X4_9BACI|nr:AraC family transcriptional regulator [Aureibacillus halotolerans]TDQ40761.1 AraC-like DNA-binding protein [Aureibacillus halotolerans]
MNSTFVQKSIQYIEHHLQHDITSEDVAKEVGYSPYHFHRKFQAEVGLSVTSYLTQRRLVYASQLLLHTSAPILDIAYDAHYDSQEAFSRAFKKVYQLPPGRYRTMFKTQQPKPKGELHMQSTSPIKHWILSGSHPDQYEIGIDEKNVHQGNKSAFLRSVTVDSENSFGTLMQSFHAKEYIGKRIRLSAFIKTEEVQHFCGLWMRVDNLAGDVIQFDNMYNRKLVGSQPWNLYAIVLDVPDDSASINFGLLLTGQGHVWLDSLRFEEVSPTVPTTSMNMENELNHTPQNLSFEE